MEYRKSNLSIGSRVWLYARHSPGKNQSIASQLNALRGYCAFNGLIIAHEFVDEGKSGGDRRRSQFNQMRKLVEDNPRPVVAGLICFDSSRLARDFKDADYTKALLRFRGYAIEFLDQESIGGLAGRILEVADDHENEAFLTRNKIKTREGLRYVITLKDTSGQYLGVWPTRPPWGFDAVKKELPIIDAVTKKARVKQCIIPNDEQFELGRHIYELRGLDGLTYRQIEDQTGFMTRRGIDVGTIDRLGRYYALFYRNEIYKGTFRYKEVTLFDYVPAMVTDELWQAANSTAATYRRGNWRGLNPKTGKGNRVFTLSGLCQCAYCKALIYPVPVGKNRYYKCGSRKRIGSNACPSQTIRAEILENAIYETTLNIFLQDDFIGELVAMVESLLNSIPDNSQIISRLDRELTDLDRRIANLVEHLELGENVASQLQLRQSQRQDKLEERRRLIETTPKPLKTSIAEVSRIFYDLRRRLVENGDIKSVYNQIISRIELAKNKAVVYYQMPPVFGYTSLGAGVDNSQLVYTIELPNKIEVSQQADLII